MSEESKREFEAASADLASRQLAGIAQEAATFGQEAVTSATFETAEVSTVIDEKRKQAPLEHQELIAALKQVEFELRKNYYDPDRITVPVSRDAVIHEDFRRKVEPIPNYVMFPRPALVRGKPIQTGEMEVPAVLNSRDGTVVKPAMRFPIYVAAGPDGGPWRDSYGEYVVIDPQTGAIRQNVKARLSVPKRNWFRVKWSLVKAWFKKFRFDFKFIKKN